MTQQEFLLLIAEKLGAAGIPFMVVGSIASGYHGQPRATNHIDMVIDPALAQLNHWVTLFGQPYYVDAESARDALRTRSMFNIIDFSEGFKADLIMRKDRPHGVEEFRRKRMEDLGGHQIPIATAEDTILTKLEWNLITPSERQVRDALNVAITQWPTLDLAYLRNWAPELGIAEDLEEVLRAAELAQLPPSK